ncbi:MAG TPA: ABC transporter ATP-binding protein [Candidatus Methylomirabilis sp.]|nr:ABC transporter ATP-binding protein [Candidatus Methylomirabilis sp.]
MNTAVRIEKLRKVFEGRGGGQVVAVDGVSLEVKDGSLVTLLGPSGCGKTTVLRMIAGFETPTEGEVFIGEERITTLPANKRRTSMVFQTYGLFPHMTVFDNVGYGLRVRRVPASEIRTRVLSMLELVGLAGTEGRLPSQLSGGQQQRVALARALITEPRVLLFDEPLSNLDAKLRVQVRLEIRRLQQRLQITSIYVTHDQDEAMTLSDQIVIMHQGRIEQVGTPQEIYARPRTRFVADFIGRGNFLAGSVWAVNDARTEVEMPLGRFRVRAEGFRTGDPVWLLLRPEAIGLTFPGAGRWDGQVSTATYLGSEVFYEVAVGQQVILVKVGHPQGTPPLASGAPVGVTFDESSLHLVPREAAT